MFECYEFEECEYKGGPPMSMTLEEAIERIGEQYKVCKEFYHLSANPEKDYPGVMSYMEALDLSLSALRPISREQVEKGWRGEWMFKPFYKGTSRGAIECQKCKSAFEGSVGFNFCPSCGAPMTDEAVQMVMERLEAMHE